MAVKITQRQAVQIRAIIKTKDSGELFDAEKHLATKEQLAEEGIDAPPIMYTIYKNKSELAPYVTSTDNAEAVDGYINIELPADSFLSAAEIEEDKQGYNFAFVPENRKTFAFKDTGQYFIDVTIYPKAGAALVFRTNLEVG